MSGSNSAEPKITAGAAVAATPAAEPVSPVGRRGMLTGLLGAGAVAGAALTAVTAGPAHAAPDPGRTRFVAKVVMPVNVKDHGAVGDGEADDSAAIQAAVSAAEEAGTSVFFPAGTYQVTEPWRADGPVALRGDGMWQTTIAVAAEGGFIDAGTRPSALVVEDLAFDNLGRKQEMLLVDGGHVHDFVFRRCRFTNLRSESVVNRNGYAAVSISNVGYGEFADCLWHNPAVYAGQGNAVRVEGPDTGGGKRLRFHGNNRMLWVNNGIRTQPNIWEHGNFGDTKPAVLESLEIDGAYFDGFWWLLPAAHANEGSGVTYSETGLSDPAADFSDVDARRRPNVTNVRAMPVRKAGKVGSASGTFLVDEAADFVAAGVKRMDIVRTDGRWAVVATTPFSEANPDVVQVEEWLDDDSLLPVAPPAAGKDYIVYGIIIAEANAKTTTTLTIEKWQHLYGGIEEVPAAGTRYEVLAIRPTYLLFNSPGGVLDLSITNSTFRRGWADLAGIRPQRSRIIGNRWEDGQESGCVISGGGFRGHHVIGNSFNHIGNSPIFVNGSESVVIGNRSSNCGWKLDIERLADISILNGERNIIADNISVAGPETDADGACVLIRQATPRPSNGPVEVSRDNVLAHNRRYGNSEDEPDVKLHGSNIVDNEIIGSRSVQLFDGATGQLMDTSGPGSPEEVLPAAPGSIYRRTDGEGTEVLYVKATGTGAAGWVPAAQGGGSDDGGGGDDGDGGGTGAMAVLLALGTTDRVRNNTRGAGGPDGIDPELSLQVEAGATYLVEGYLVFNSSESADMKLGWESPDGSTLSWVANGPAVNTTSGNTVVNRRGVTEVFQINLGGTGQDVVVLPTGRLTVGDSAGEFAVRWAQAVAEASDTIRRADSWLRLTKVS